MITSYLCTTQVCRCWPAHCGSGQRRDETEDGLAPCKFPASNRLPRFLPAVNRVGCLDWMDTLDSGGHSGDRGPAERRSVSSCAVRHWRGEFEDRAVIGVQVGGVTRFQCPSETMSMAQVRRAPDRHSRRPGVRRQSLSHHWRVFPPDPVCLALCVQRRAVTIHARESSQMPSSPACPASVSRSRCSARVAAAGSSRRSSSLVQVKPWTQSRAAAMSGP
jgi:hypothetical protein